jgi:hypothetical protein
VVCIYGRPETAWNSFSCDLFLHIVSLNQSSACQWRGLRIAGSSSISILAKSKVRELGEQIRDDEG